MGIQPSPHHEPGLLAAALFILQLLQEAFLQLP